MKNTILLTLGFISISSSIYAQQVSFRARCQQSATLAVCKVENRWNLPLVCTGTAEGVTRNGYYAYIDANNIIVPPGQYRTLHAETSDFDPFVNVRSGIRCKTFIPRRW